VHTDDCVRVIFVVEKTAYPKETLLVDDITVLSIYA